MFNHHLQNNRLTENYNRVFIKKQLIKLPKNHFFVDPDGLKPMPARRSGLWHEGVVFCAGG